MKNIFFLPLILALFFINSAAFCQHSLQLDDGLGHFSTIQAGNPGVTLTLPSTTGTLLTYNGHSSPAWLTNGNSGTTPPAAPLTINLSTNSFIGTTDNKELDFVTNG